MSLLELSRATPEFRCSCSMGSLVRDRGRTGTLMTRFSKEWWRSLPDAGIGIPTGTPSDALERQYGQLPVTLEPSREAAGGTCFFRPADWMYGTAPGNSAPDWLFAASTRSPRPDSGHSS